MSGRPLLNRRLDGLGTTIFAEMSALAVRTGAINLGQGFPDTDGPEEVREAAVRALRDGRGNQYPPGPGVPELRTADRRAPAALLRPGLRPRHRGAGHRGRDRGHRRRDAGPAGARRRGHRASSPSTTPTPPASRWPAPPACPLTLRAPDFRPDLDALRDAVTPRTRLLLLNSPHNPTGMVLTRDELTAIAELAVEHDLLVVTDEVYEHLVFDGAHIPLVTLPGMRDRTVSISSAGQDLLLHGLEGRLGHGVRRPGRRRPDGEAVPDLRLPPARSSTPSPRRSRFPDTLLRPASATTCGPSATCWPTACATAGFEVYRPQGTYFITTDITPLGDKDAFAFCRALPERCGVVAVPNSVFYDDPDAGRSQVRFAFCKRDDVLHEAAARLRGLCRRQTTLPGDEARRRGGPGRDTGLPYQEATRKHQQHGSGAREDVAPLHFGMWSSRVPLSRSRPSPPLVLAGLGVLLQAELSTSHLSNSIEARTQLTVGRRSAPG